MDIALRLIPDSANDISWKQSPVMSIAENRVSHSEKSA